jgi:hypothetical protein
MTAATVGAFLLVVGGVAWRMGQPISGPESGSTEATVSYLDQPFGTQPVPGIEEEGFHNPEVSARSGERFRWTNGAAKLVVPLHGRPPKALLLSLAIGIPRPRLQIRVNGQTLIDELPSQDQWTQMLDLSAMNLGSALKLEILSDACVPAKQGKGSSDERILGVRVLAIKLISGTQGFVDVPLGVRAVPEVTESGFHRPQLDNGVPSRWTNGSARLTVPLRGQTPRVLVLTLDIPDRPGYRVRVAVNGKTLYDDQVRPYARWSVELPLAEVNLGENAEIELDSSTFVPAEVQPGSTDRRTLGVWVKQIILR